jgi:hypothetical protein
VDLLCICIKILSRVIIHVFSIFSNYNANPAPPLPILRKRKRKIKKNALAYRSALEEIEQGSMLKVSMEDP